MIANLTDEQIREMLAKLEDEQGTKVKKVKFAPFEEASVVSDQPDFALFDGIKVELLVELSNAEMTVRELLELEEEHVIKLDKLAGEPVDLKFNGEGFAKGEVVIINEAFGVRISNLMDHNDD